MRRTWSRPGGKGTGNQHSTSTGVTVMLEYNFLTDEQCDSSSNTNRTGNSSDMNPVPISADLASEASMGSGEEIQRRDKFQRMYSLILYSITTILLFADQNLLAPNLSAIADEFGYDNDERDKKLGGDIALGFFLLGAPASFLVGCAADSNYIRRSFLFGLIVLIGEGSCFLTYYTTSYTGLYVTRILTGFSVGGALPLLASVLSDWFPPQHRSAVMAFVGMGMGIGISIGQGIAGILGPLYGWRLPFLVVSTPAILISILFMTTVKDPIRGQSERDALNIERHNANGSNIDIDIYVGNNDTEGIEQNVSPLRINSFEPVISSSNNDFDLIGNLDGRNGETDEVRHRCNRLFILFKPSTYASHLNTTKELFQSKTVIFLMIQGIPGCVPWGIVGTFLNDYLSEDCGLSIQAATSIILVFGLGNGLGIVVGGAGGDFLYKKDSRYPALLSGFSAILGCFPLWALVNNAKVQDNDDFHGWMMIRTGLIASMAGFFSGVTGPIVKASLQNVTLPNSRGQAFALQNTFDDFGRGLGPVFVASLIVALGGRQAAFNIGIFGWIFCGLLNLCIFWTIKSDEELARQKFLDCYIHDEPNDKNILSQGSTMEEC